MKNIEVFEKISGICCLMINRSCPDFESILRVSERALNGELKPVVAKKLIESHADEIVRWTSWFNEFEEIEQSGAVEIYFALRGFKDAGEELHYLI